MKFYLYIIAFFTAINCIAQLEVVPIYREPQKINQNKSARVESLPPLHLPFWDDFSFNNSPFFPNDTLWENSSSVWVNSGEGINPPSLNVATFDGYDAFGKPYSANAPLAKGIADSLTSRALRLGDIPPAQRPFIFISFFYQFKGNGDAPEPGDILSLLFRNSANQWVQVWQIENNGSLKQDEFVKITIPIAGDNYFHNNFQFRFQNFGRLSGPYDTWNIDYVYVSNGVSQQINPSIKDFPDRAVSTPMSSPFDQYQSVPLNHFRVNPSLIKPSITLVNQRMDQNVGGQPLSYDSKVLIYEWKNGVVSSSLQVLDTRIGIGGALLYGQPKNVKLNTLPDLTSLDPLTDSISMHFTFNIDTSDNVLIIPAVKGDFDPAVYKGIDFRFNDTTKSIFTLANYYAYDDGVAEYGAKITGSGTQLAYQFDMKTTEADTIVAIDLYFPRFGDNSNQTIQLQIMGGLEGKETDYLYKQNIVVKLNNRDTLWRVKIPGGVRVQTKFFIGWRLTSTAIIPIGLDRNTDSGDKMFVNANGEWEQNTSLKGSLMIRPVFGNPGLGSIITSLADRAWSKPYPNPTQHTFFLPLAAQQIQLYDFSGRDIPFSIDAQLDKKQITITHPINGLYLVRYFDLVWHTEKVRVQP